MFRTEPFELPAVLKEQMRKANRLEWVTLVYLISVIILMYLVLGNSQAMKAAWLEDVLSIFPYVAFLVAVKFYDRAPSKTFPYGYHIAFLTGALALFLMGCFLVTDSSITLITADHPTIGSIQIWGYQVWMGWLMILVLLYSALPAMVLGFKKLPLAKDLHNKILFTDAAAQKADYLTAFAAITGIFGVG